MPGQGFPAGVHGPAHGVAHKGHVRAPGFRDFPGIRPEAPGVRGQGQIVRLAETQGREALQIVPVPGEHGRAGPVQALVAGQDEVRIVHEPGGQGQAEPLQQLAHAALAVQAEVVHGEREVRLEVHGRGQQVLQEPGPQLRARAHVQAAPGQVQGGEGLGDLLHEEIGPLEQEHPGLGPGEPGLPGLGPEIRPPAGLQGRVQDAVVVRVQAQPERQGQGREGTAALLQLPAGKRREHRLGIRVIQPKQAGVRAEALAQAGAGQDRGLAVHHGQGAPALQEEFQGPAQARAQKHGQALSGQGQEGLLGLGSAPPPEGPALVAGKHPQVGQTAVTEHRLHPVV